MADKQFFQLQGNLGDDPKPSERRSDILNLRLAVNPGYGDDVETEWWNVSIFEEGKPHLVAFANENLHKGSRGVYVEGYGTIKDGNKEGRKFRDIVASRIGLVEFVTPNSAPSTDDGDDY